MTDDATRLVPAQSLLGPPGPADAAPFPGVAAALAARLRADGARPMVTFYDDATGERVELSGVTLDNWVAKTANLLVDTLGLGPGDRVGVDLPTHWLAVVILLAAWSAGLEVLVAPGPTDAAAGAPASGAPTSGPTPAGAGRDGSAQVQAIFAAESRLDAALALGADEVVALSLRPLGGRMAHPVAGVLDFAAEVPPHGDRFAAPRPPAAQASLLARAAGVAASVGLGAGDRLLATAGPGEAEGLLAGVLVPLVTGASVVLCRHLDDHLDDAAFARRIATERVTAARGPGRSLPAGVRPIDLAAAVTALRQPPRLG